MITIAQLLNTLTKIAANERKWLRSIKNDPKATEVSLSLIAAVAAVADGKDWSAHEAALLRCIENMERGATEGYPADENCESMQRYAEYRKLLNLPTRQA